MAKEEKRIKRNFPNHSIKDVLIVAQKITDENAGKPMNRLLLADALAISPSSTNFRDILSSSQKYDLTMGNNKSVEISLTDIGIAVTQNDEAQARINNLRSACLKPPLFSKFFNDYSNKKLPSEELFTKILISNYNVPEELAEECKSMIIENGNFVGILREIQGALHIIMDAEEIDQEKQDIETNEANISQEKESTVIEDGKGENEVNEGETAEIDEERKSKPIFIGHGKNKAPLEKIQAVLTSFRIPHKVTIAEPNLGRPIPKKVKDVLHQCGSAILIFTKDVKYFSSENEEIWKPSENVVHELGACSYLYEDRIVIFKEKGLTLPTNFSSIGYIEFEIDSIESKTADLLKELIGFGLVKITPA
ncbi:TIR domain-containing protein [Marispirochaeta aestuarii]|uniref:TIR domain-containing protein n=1 Tax=Marispirochaeta aestuarii TaxID=1963862 RepID=UPI002ABD4570|nr:TIR domain-containing protein [Marispirochaeta aestuarii]